MKRLILLITVMLAVMSGYAQKPQFDLNKSLVNKKNNYLESNSFSPHPIEELVLDKKAFLEALEETIFQLDSIVIESYNTEAEEWKLAEKFQYEVGESENITNYMKYIWDDNTGEWFGYPLYIYEYNESGSLVRKVTNEFSYDGTTILKFFKHEYLYTYENGGTQENYTYYKGNSNLDVLIPDLKKESYYDENENLLKYNSYHWNSELEDWVNIEKSEYEYDENGNQTLELKLDWFEGLDDWYGEKKIEYGFDEIGNKTFEIFYDWDTKSTDFLKDYKVEYDYNEAGELVTETFLIPDESEGEWVNYSRKENSYDTSGNKITFLRSNWNEEKDSWIPEYKEENGFDSASNQTFSSSYTWSEELNQLTGIQKQKFDYDEDGNRILTSSYIWNNDMADWIFEKYLFKSEHEFNTSGKVVLKTNFEWRNEQWMKSSRYEYDYDAMGRKIFEQSANWIDDFSDWRYSKKQELAFNIEGKYLLQIDYEWDVEKNEWKLLYRYEYDYDANGRTTLISSLRYNFSDYYDGRRSEYIFDDDRMQTFYGSYIWDKDLNQWVGRTKSETTYIEKNVPLVGTSFNWDVALNDWSFKSRITYYYTEEIVQSAPEIPSDDFVNIYPNPAIDYLTIELSGENTQSFIELYDFNGRKIIRKDLSTGNRISVQNLTSGIYFWKIIQEKNTKTGKILIE